MGNSGHAAEGYAPVFKKFKEYKILEYILCTGSVLVF